MTEQKSLHTIQARSSKQIRLWIIELVVTLPSENNAQQYNMCCLNSFGVNIFSGGGSFNSH